MYWNSYLIFVLANLVFAWLSHNYRRDFGLIIVEQVYNNFAEVFPQVVILPLASLKSQASLPSYRLNVNLEIIHMLIWGILIAGLTLFLQRDLYFSLWLSAVAHLLFVIGWLDWRYRLIPLQLCLGLYALMVVGAYENYLNLDVFSSLINGIVSFGLFYGIFYVAKFAYGQEAMGRGDCWLMLALGASVELVFLPWLVLIACVVGLSKELLSFIKKMENFSSIRRASLPNFLSKPSKLSENFPNLDNNFLPLGLYLVISSWSLMVWQFVMS